MPSPHPHPSSSRRGFLLAGAGAGAALALTAAPSWAGPGRRPFGRFGSPAARLTPQTLYVDPAGRGDHTSVSAAVSAASGSGWTLVLAPGTYRETVAVSAARTGTTWIGASENPRDVVIVYDNAAGTPSPAAAPSAPPARPPPPSRPTASPPAGSPSPTTGCAPTTRASPAPRRWP